MRKRVLLRAPAVEHRHDIAQRAARLCLQLLGLGERTRGLEQRQVRPARMELKLLQRGITQPPARHVDDALEGKVVGRLIDEPQIGERIADFGALVEARAADHPIGQAERDEAVLELAHLERGAHQDRDLVERVSAALQLLDLLADRARFLFRIPCAGDADLLARLVLGAQRLAEAAFVVRDQV